MARITSFAVTPGGQLAVDGDAHVLRLALDQRLRGEHMLDLAGADAVGERAEGAVRRGMAVAADDGHAGQGEALLGADDVDDALPAVELANNTRCRSRARSRRASRPAARDSGSSMPWLRSVVGTLWSTTASVFSGARTLRSREAQALEGLRAGHLVHEVAVDIEEAGAVGLARRRRGRPRSCRRGFSVSSVCSSLGGCGIANAAARGRGSAAEERAVGGEEPREEAGRQARVVADRREGAASNAHRMPARRAPRPVLCRDWSHARYIAAAAAVSIATLPARRGRVAGASG